MADDFKVPTFEPKFKAPAKKEKQQSDNENEAKEIPVTPSITTAEESESGKVQSDLQKAGPKCPYVEPKWSKTPDSDLAYSFEVLKGGQIVENVKDLQTKALWRIGKLPNNDIVMAHPTISRFHAVIQYRPEMNSKETENDSSDDDDEEGDSTAKQNTQKPKIDKGWYLYDLNSTHGSFVNKMKVPPKTYIRLRVGYMLKFGAITRNYILQGPGFDEEAESELTITEMKELKLKRQQEAQEKLLEEEKRKEEEGISWGMADDADEETDLSHNPFASSNNEELFLQDPKKTLRGFFEREGLNLDYKMDEVSNGTYVCKVELPITDSIGRSIVAEFTHKGKKKECVVQCALEACRILDRNGLLRQANHEPRKRKVESSSDDDDEFYDRTIEAEQKRRRKAGTEESVTLSYDQLLEEEQKLQTQLIDTEKRMERYQQLEKEAKQKEAMDVDDLDDFMSGLSNEKKMDKLDVRKCRLELLRIKADIQKVNKLINIARPAELPPLKPFGESKSDGIQTKKRTELPLFGKKRTFGFDKLKHLRASQKSTPSSSTVEMNCGQSIEEFDDEDIEKDPKPSRKNVDMIDENSYKMEDIKEHEAKSCDKQTIQPTSESTNRILVKTDQAETSMSEKPPSENLKQKLLNDEDPSASREKISTPQIVQNDANRQPINQKNAESGASNKNRSKNRNRGNKARYQVDIDETEEDLSPQKYSGWVPPNNQTGDGMTDLNSKFGY